MKSRLFSIVGAVVLLFMLVGALFPLATPATATVDNPIKPIIFVHGFAGSAQQFESQMMRFDSNGYPASYIFALEYNTSPPDPMATIWARLDTLIANVKAQTGASQVYLLGHSYGTYVCQGYLAFPSRAANVAKYVNIDGAVAGALPGGRPTLALWATKGFSYNPANQIVGATNIFVPNQTHVQVATSAESFIEMYKFFMGYDPGTTDVLPGSSNQLALSGRAVFFPANLGVGDGTLEIWKVNAATGARTGVVPEVTYTLTGTGPDDGTWGPFTADMYQHYEFVIVRTGYRPHHFYPEPFIRNDHFVRLLTSPPGGLGDQMERDTTTVAMVIMRQKEFWGDQGADNDSLTINSTNIINTVTCPVMKSPPPNVTGVIGIFAYDRYLNTITDLNTPIPYFYQQGFMTGVDIYMPGADQPTGTISLVLTPRGGNGNTQTINMLNWASISHSTSAMFNDFVLPSQPTDLTDIYQPETQKPQASPSLPTQLKLNPAQLSLQYLSVSPQQTIANQPVTILTNVVNTGDEAGNLNVALKINGQVEQTRMVSVGPQASQPVRFTVTKTEPGTYTVDILNQQGSFIINGESTSATGKSASTGLIILIGIAALVLIAVVVLVLSFR
jgi:pimeloyl-ACP methyl ester carboxylesterase